MYCTECLWVAINVVLLGPIETILPDPTFLIPIWGVSEEWAENIGYLYKIRDFFFTTYPYFAALLVTANDKKK